MPLRVRNWEKFQHYKDRRPPWIKLYNELLDDYSFGCLPDASKWHLVAIWLLAGRTDNSIPDDPKWIARMVAADQPVNIEILVSAGFIERYGDASSTLAGRSGFAMPETEAEEETKADASPLAGNFADPDHAAAYERLRLASGRGFAVDAGLRGVAQGMGAGPAYDWPTIGQALVEMDAAGAKFSAEAVRGFCRRLLRPNPALGGNGAPTRQDRNLAVLNDWLAKEQASGNP